MSALLAVVEEAGADGSIGGFVIVCAVFAVFFMWVGYVVRGQEEAERRREHRPLCPRCQSPLSPPRPLPNGRRR